LAASLPIFLINVQVIQIQERSTFKPPGLKEQRALHLQTLVNEYNPVVKQDLIQSLTLLDQ